MLLRKIVRFIEEMTGMNSKISGGICLAVCYILLFVLLYYLIRTFTVEIMRLFEYLPDFYETKIVPSIKRFEQNLAQISGGNGDFEKMLRTLLSAAEVQLSQFLKTLSTNAAEQIAKFVFEIPNLLITLTVTIIASFFICIDYDKINIFLLSQLSENARAKFFEIKNVFCKAIWRICYSYLLIFLITFAQLAAGLSLLKVNYALTISAVIAVTDIFPMIGTGTVLIPWAVIEFFNGNQPLALGLVVLYLIITVVRNIVEPKIIGKNIGLHPLLTLVSMYIGLKIGGVFTAMILPFILIIIKHLNDNGAICLYRNVRQD